MASIYKDLGISVYEAIHDLKKAAEEIVPDIDWRLMEGYYQDELSVDRDTLIFVPTFPYAHTNAMGNLDVEVTITVECYIVIDNKVGRRKKDYFVDALNLMDAIMHYGRNGTGTILSGGEWHIVSTREKSGFVSKFTMEINIAREMKRGE